MERSVSRRKKTGAGVVRDKGLMSAWCARMMAVPAVAQTRGAGAKAEGRPGWSVVPVAQDVGHDL